MGGRIGIPDSAVDRRAKLYGIEVTEILQEKLDECVNVVLISDSEKYKVNSE